MEPIFTIVNNDNLNFVETYRLIASDMDFNIKKFKELMKYSNLSLNKDFTYRGYSGAIITEKVPLVFPFSTLLLSYLLGPQFTKDLAYEVTDDYILANAVATFCNKYNPLYLYPLYKDVYNDAKLNYQPNECLLEKVLKQKNPDLLDYRDIFNRLNFEFSGYSDMTDVGRYMKKYSIENVIPGAYLQDRIAQYEVANENRKVIKKLMLTPNIIN